GGLFFGFGLGFGRSDVGRCPLHGGGGWQTELLSIVQCDCAGRGQQLRREDSTEGVAFCVIAPSAVAFEQRRRRSRRRRAYGGSDKFGRSLRRHSVSGCGLRQQDASTGKAVGKSA